MKKILLVLLSVVSLVSAKDTTLVIPAKSIDTSTVTVQQPVLKKRAASGSIPLFHEINKSVAFAELAYDSVYDENVVNEWKNVSLPLRAKKLFISKSVVPTSALEIYGRILLKCKEILPYEALKGKPLSEVKDKCFDFQGVLFQQFEEKAGLYNNGDDYFYLSLLSLPPEAVSGWVKVTDTFTYNTAMGDTKSVIHIEEILLFIERSLME